MDSYRILEGALQIAVPALVLPCCICIVFVPMFMLGGVARYLFVPLAEAVVFAMLALYVLSRTLVPTMAAYLLRAKSHHDTPARNPFVWFQRGFERRFERVRNAYQGLLTKLVHRRFIVIPVFLVGMISLLGLRPWLGRISFRTPTAANSPAPAREGRPADRGNGTHRRSGRSDNPRSGPSPRASDHHR